MRVKLIKRQTIEDYVKSNSGSKLPFQLWLAAINIARWRNAKDILQTFGNADLLGKNSNRVVFNIGGNNYRMICKYIFKFKKVHLLVCFIGTHAEYTKLCDKEQQYSVWNY